MNRVRSGIKGLDSLLSGGFPSPSVILVEGEAGAGKSTFGLHFLMEGAKNDEIGLYITTMSEKFNWMIHFMSTFSFFNPLYFDRNIILYEDIGREIMEEEFPKILKKIDYMIARYTPKRIVIDPINPVIRNIPDSRNFLFELVTSLKNWDSVTIITGEVENEKNYSNILYLADGIIDLIIRNEGDIARRYIQIRKMRGTEHSLSLHPLNLTSNGLEVLKAKF